MDHAAPAPDPTGSIDGTAKPFRFDQGSGTEGLRDRPEANSGSLLAAGKVSRADLRDRTIMFGLWLALVLWFCSTHIFWRDEVRAFSIALSGSTLPEMLRNLHGEGHPALWYLILRGAHALFPYREVLPVAAAVIGIAGMGLLTFLSPFRTIVIAVILFSFSSAFESVVIARNYGISALVMFGIAALYTRTRNSLYFGVLLATLCNTNVPSCLIAAGFLLFRFVELLSDRPGASRRDWLVFAGNAALSAVGAVLCFITVYPTFNDAAISPNMQHLGVGSFFLALADREWGFAHLGFENLFPFPTNAVLLALSCMSLIRRPAALVASLVVLLVLKLFFYFVYTSYLRHEILFVVYLISLHWIVAEGAGGRWHREWRSNIAQFAGTAAFVLVLAFQLGRLGAPIRAQLGTTPFSQIASVGKLLQRPELSGAIVMGDPDTMLEPLSYYAGNPIWFMREQRFGRVVHLATAARRDLTYADMLSDAQRLHARTGRPVVILSHLPLQDRRRKSYRVMFADTTTLIPAQVRQFRASTRLLARLRPSDSDEDYDVFVYPR